MVRHPHTSSIQCLRFTQSADLPTVSPAVNERSAAMPLSLALMCVPTDLVSL